MPPAIASYLPFSCLMHPNRQHGARCSSYRVFGFAMSFSLSLLEWPRRVQVVQKKALDSRMKARSIATKDRPGEDMRCQSTLVRWTSSVSNATTHQESPILHTAGALRHLKMAKRYDAQVATIRGGMDKLETLKVTLESQQHMKGFVDSIGSGARMLKATNAQMDADDIGELMGDMEEEMAVATEVGDAIAQPLAGDMAMESELEDELNQMVEEQALAGGTGAVAAPAAAPAAADTGGYMPAMPSVPSGEPTAAPAAASPAPSGRVAMAAGGGAGGGSGGGSAAPSGFEDLEAMMS